MTIPKIAHTLGKTRDGPLQLIVPWIDDGGTGVLPARGLGGQALQPELVANHWVRVVVAVPRPVRRGGVDHPQPPVPEARLPRHRQWRQPVVLVKANKIDTARRVISQATTVCEMKRCGLRKLSLTWMQGLLCCRRRLWWCTRVRTGSPRCHRPLPATAMRIGTEPININSTWTWWSTGDGWS